MYNIIFKEYYYIILNRLYFNKYEKNLKTQYLDIIIIIYNFIVLES